MYKNYGILRVNVTIILSLLALVVSTIYPQLLNADQVQYCVSADSDTDGDGWGWENSTSCRIAPEPQTRTIPLCVSDETDPDGDGWGWENFTSCRIVSKPQARTTPLCDSDETDPDGDGWGYENGVSCLVDNSLPPPATASKAITFNDVARTSAIGVNGYRRTPSVRHTHLLEFLKNSLITPITVNDIVETPMRSRGIPGVALFDYDHDGDLDMYVTNGPGTANTLYSNQLRETAEFTFIDVAEQAGVAAKSQDSNGVCFGDTDNDGDNDLIVVGHDTPPILYENSGNGTFVDVSDHSGINTGKSGNSCVLGDIDNDGLLDLFVARGYPLNSLRECFFDFTSDTIQANDLFLNTGNNKFQDISESSGIRDLVSGGMPEGINTIAWSAALVDYDLDGDLDLMVTEDQCNFPGTEFGGLSRGTIQLFRNNGSGYFINHTIPAGLTLASEWMGTAWADFNHDGHLDVFVTSFGDWAKQFVGAPITLGNESSRWYLGDGNGGFIDPGLGALIYTPFGWGTSAEDFDNDGDTDLVFQGGLDMVTIAEKSNPGGYMVNDGDAHFAYDPAALGLSHRRRNDSGVAAGDLNEDGYIDIVSVSNFNAPEPLPLVPYSVGGIDYGSPWDPAFFVPVMDTVDDGLFSWNGVSFENGDLALELNNGETAFESVRIDARGSSGLVVGAKTNRSAIGATLFFTPDGGKTAIKPVLGGSSHASQDALSRVFGMGSSMTGTLEVLWSGGTRNRLYDVRAGDNIVLPEIPCNYLNTEQRPSEYKRCVKSSVKRLVQKRVISKQFAHRLVSSAWKAFQEERNFSSQPPH